MKERKYYHLWKPLTINCELIEYHLKNSGICYVFRHRAGYMTYEQYEQLVRDAYKQASK